MKEQFYITTTIPYVNAEPHIGHAYEYICADVLARYWRQKGVETKFVTGTDEHGQKNVRVAAEKGVTPQEHVDEMVDTFKLLLSKLNCSYDDFVRTTEERHMKAAQAFWEQAMDSGDIEKDSYEGLYCVGCEAFKTEKELVDGRCQAHKKEPERIREENYFFRLSRYQNRLLEYYEKHPEFIVPSSKKNEIVNLVKDGLDDISISREKEKLSWGVAVPGDDTQVMYVWFEALINYITALGFPDDEQTFEKWWPADVHMLGKDVNRFHSVIWPAMCMAAGIEPPQQCAVHGFITISGEKMSKTIGNVVNPVEIVDAYGADQTRYFFMREISYAHDGDFSYTRLKERYSADLANGLGNLLSRVTNMVEKYFDGTLEALPREEGYGDAQSEQYHKAMTSYQFHHALDAVWSVVDESNEYIEQNKPWELVKSDTEHLRTVLQHLLYSLNLISEWLIPFMPETAETMSSILGEDKIVKSQPLFPRLEEGENQ
ncbi:MAG: methionine--tRNA ligase [Candidatus Kerfeldbacteria bacterium]